MNDINMFCIHESFNTNILHQLFDYKITIGNSQAEKTISKGDFVLKTELRRIFKGFKICGKQK